MGYLAVRWVPKKWDLPGGMKISDKTWEIFPSDNEKGAQKKFEEMVTSGECKEVTLCRNIKPGGPNWKILKRVVC